MAKPGKVHQSQPHARVLTRDLLVIDNQPLRERHFLEAQKVLQKIERLEEKIHAFHTSDQKLFNQWVDLTFRTHRSAIEQARSKYHELARFHNWIVATARKLGIEMHKAYVLMREEQIRWNAGNEEVREEIDRAREQREEYIRQEFRARYNENFEFSSQEDWDPANGGIEGLEEILDEIENSFLDADPRFSDFSDTAEERIARINALSDEQLLQALESKEISFMLFDVSMSWGQTHHEYSLFKRIWQLLTPEQKTFFANVYGSVTEEPIEEFLMEIGLSPEWDGEEDEEKGPHLDEDSGGPSYHFSEGPSSRPDEPPQNEEKLKSLFRKLMRQLHPDRHAAKNKDGSQASWVQRVWGLVQKAYNDKDIESLERLLKLTYIRMNALDELSISEISEASQCLKKDLKNLENESAEMKRSLAWGFSKKKNYDTLTKKMEKQFELELHEVTEQVEDLEHQHYLFEILSQQSRRRPQSRPRATRTRPRSRRQSRYQEFYFEE